MLTLSSCLDGDDDKKDDPQPDPDPVPEVSCVLTKMNTSWDNGVQTYTYNNKGNITALTNVSNGNTRVRSFIYDANDRMVKEEVLLNGVLQEYITYSYTNGLVSRREWFDANGQSKRYQTSSYDANGHMTEYNRYTGSKVEKGVLTYTAEGNIATHTVYVDGNLSSTLTYQNYDDKKYYQTAIKGLQLSGVSANKNNYRKLTQVIQTSGQPVTREFLYEYTYNEQGYPTREVETVEGEQYIYDLTYECK